MANSAVHCLFVMVDPEHNHNLLFAGTESLIEAWNAASSEPCGEFKGHEDRVNCLKTHKGDLMSASQDGTGNGRSINAPSMDISSPASGLPSVSKFTSWPSGKGQNDTPGGVRHRSPRVEN